MEFNEYNESVKNWTNGILDNYRKDAELTIRYCHELIDYGEKTADSKLLGFGYYHLAMTLYCLNDYDNIFDIVVRAIDHLEKAQSVDRADMDENYTYIVRCADGTLYTGWTNDLKKRIKAHNSGKGAKYTKTRRPVELVYFEHFATKEEAMSREYHIKQLKRAQKQALIDEMNKNNKSIFTQNG